MSSRKTSHRAQKRRPAIAATREVVDVSRHVRMMIANLGQAQSLILKAAPAALRQDTLDKSSAALNAYDLIETVRRLLILLADGEQDPEILARVVSGKADA